MGDGRSGNSRVLFVYGSVGVSVVDLVVVGVVGVVVTVCTVGAGGLLGGVGVFGAVGAVGVVSFVVVVTVMLFATTEICIIRKIIKEESVRNKGLLGVHQVKKNKDNDNVRSNNNSLNANKHSLARTTRSA